MGGLNGADMFARRCVYLNKGRTIYRSVLHAHIVCSKDALAAASYPTQTVTPDPQDDNRLFMSDNRSHACNEIQHLAYQHFPPGAGDEHCVKSLTLEPRYPTKVNLGHCLSPGPHDIIAYVGALFGASLA